jgi:hypothetical protein
VIPTRARALPRPPPGGRKAGLPGSIQRGRLALFCARWQSFYGSSTLRRTFLLQVQLRFLHTSHACAVDRSSFRNVAIVGAAAPRALPLMVTESHHTSSSLSVIHYLFLQLPDRTDRSIDTLLTPCPKTPKEEPGPSIPLTISPWAKHP